MSDAHMSNPGLPDPGVPESGLDEARRPLPPELQEELAQRTEGAELAQVWELLALADPVAGSSEADAVWSRISAQIASGRPLLTPVAGTPAVQAAPARETPSSVRGTGATRSIAAGTREMPSRWRRQAPWAIAATLAVAVGVGSWRSRPVTLEAPIGEQLAVTLPDGSVAELNAGSRVEYRTGFRSRFGLAASSRDVRLEGEAFFTVEPADRPFEVRTSDARVTVVGTRFLVRARAGEPEGTAVAVESGRVRVRAEGAGLDSAVELGAGEGTVVRPGARQPLAVAAVGVERLTLWRRGGFALVDQPLDAIFRELERRYAVDIRLKDVVVGEERLRVYYPERPSIETVLADLCTPRGLKFSRTSRGFEIRPSMETPVPTP
jgi:transmembrane sensor